MPQLNTQANNHPSEKVIRISLPSHLMTPLAIIVAGAMISASILYAGTGSVLGQKTTKTTTATNTGTTQPTTDNTNQPTTADAVEGLRASDHIRGDSNADILLIEYSDPDCPYCATFHNTAKQAVDQYQGKVAWVYRHFPIVQLHPNAQTKAESMECVANLGDEDKFWAYADLLYSNQAVTVAQLASTAAGLGLDQSSVQDCIDKKTSADYVNSDQQTGIDAGVQGTPGNFLYKQSTGETITIPGAVPITNLKTSIDQLLGS